MHPPHDLTLWQGLPIVLGTIGLMGLMFYLLGRSYDKSEKRWELLSEGTVLASQVCQVPFIPTQEYGNGWPEPPAVMTVLTLQEGQTVAVLGDHSALCTPGSKVSVWRNGTDRFKVTGGEQPSA